MDLFTRLATFFLVWWTVLFAVLPWGVRPDARPEPGTVESAPARPHLLLKILVTTVVAAVITLLIGWTADSGLISFRVTNPGD